MKSYPDNLNLISPAIYRVTVIGSLDESWSGRLGGLEILNIEPYQDSHMSIVTLTGKVADQAALMGILNALYNLRMPLLAVECLCNDESLLE